MFPYQEIEDEWYKYWLLNLLKFENKWTEYRYDNELIIEEGEYFCITNISNSYDYHINRKKQKYIKIRNLKVNCDGHWYWRDIFNNLNITWKIIQENEDKINNYACVSLNPNITWEIVQKHPDKDWSYVFLSKNPNITWEIVQSNPNKDWNYDYWLSSNPNITWEIVQENPNNYWDYNQLSKHPNITWEIVCKNPDKDWNYFYLSENPNITLDIVESNPDKDWHYYGLSSNPNITFDYIDKTYKEDWSLYRLGDNEFTLEKDLFFKKKLREWFRKSDLKRELIAKLWHPKNYEKFKYYDPEMFLEDQEE